MSGIDAQWLLKIMTKEFAGGTCSFLGGIEIMLHDKTTSHNRRRVCNGKRSDAGNPACEHAMRDGPWKCRQHCLRHNKKTGRKINSPPGLKLGVFRPESFRGCYQALGLSASFSSLFFSLLLSFSLPSTLFPPFNPQRAERCEVFLLTSLPPLKSTLFPYTLPFC